MWNPLAMQRLLDKPGLKELLTCLSLYRHARANLLGYHPRDSCRHHQRQGVAGGMKRILRWRARTPGRNLVGCCWLLLVVVGCCWLLLVVVGCCWLLLVVVGCCWLLLVFVGCCWLLLVVVGCCWLLLVVVGCCWLLLIVVVDCCCWSFRADVRARFRSRFPHRNSSFFCVPSH